MTWTPYPLPTQESKWKNKKINKQTKTRMLKTLRGTLFLSFAGRKTMFRLWSLYWLEKSVDTVDKSMLLQEMFFSELSVIREHIRVFSFRRIQKRIFDRRFAGFRGRKEREIRNWICKLSQTHCGMHDSLSRNDVFLLFANYVIMVGSSNSDDGT